MSNHVKISPRQFTVLVIFYTIGTTIIIIPSALAVDAKQDAWIAAILGVILGLLVAVLYNSVSKLFPGMTLVQYNEELFGKWAGKAVSLLYIFFGFIGAATVLFYVGNFLTTQVMPETPIEAFNILFVCIVVMGLRLGLETIARSAEIFLPWFVMLFLVVAIFVLPQIRFENIQPVFETGIKPIIKAALSFIGTASFTLIVFFMIYPAYVNSPQKARKGLLFGTVVGGLFMIVITLLTILVLGPDLTARQFYPSYSLAKKITLGNFELRIESIVAGLWFITIYYKLTLYFYSCVLGLTQILKLKDHRPLILPLAMIVVVYSLVVYPNIVYAAKWDTTVWLPYILTFGLIMPLFLLGAAAVKRRLTRSRQ